MATSDVAGLTWESLRAVLFPSKIIDCASAADTQYSAIDTRVDYQCSKSAAVLWPITAVHMIIMACVFLGAICLGVVMVKIQDSRAGAQRRRLPTVSVRAAVAPSGKETALAALAADAVASARLATSWSRRR